MQKTAYYCDQCKRIIGDIIHLSLVATSPVTGLAIPPKSLFGKGDGPANWTVKQLPVNFLHLHIICVQKYFENQLKIQLKKQATKK